MDVLLINYEFPPIGGGAGNATKNIAKAMASLGQNVLVVTSRYKDLLHEEKVDGYRILRIPNIRRRSGQGGILEMVVFIFSGIWQTRRIVNDWKPDKVVSFFSIPCGVIAYFLKKFYHLNYIVSLRGGDVPGFYANRLGFYQKLTLPLNKLVWKDAEAIIANSNSLRALASGTANKINRQVEIIPNGVDIDFFHPDEKLYETAKFNILFSGRLCFQKRIDLIIDAIDRIIQKYPDYRCRVGLTIIGEGPLDKDLKAQVERNGLDDCIKFIDWLKKDELALEYRKADVFVIASSDEGMSNVALEAIASGLPIITTHVGGMDQLVHDNGFFIPFNDSEVLATRIIELFTDPILCKNMGLASRRVAKNMSWLNTAKQYLEYLDRIPMEKQLIEERFNKEASIWGNKHRRIRTIIDWEVQKRKFLTLEFIKAYWAGKSAEILEVGCGSGENICELLSFREDWGITGVDISAGMIEKCKMINNNSRVKFEKMDINREAPDGKYDVILLLGVVGYLEDNADVMKRLNNILNPGGMLIFTYGNSFSVFRIIRKLVMQIFKIHVVQKLAGKSYYDVSGYFMDYPPKEISKAIPVDYQKLAEFGLCYTAGLLGRISVCINKIIEPILIKRDFLNLAMTKLAIYRKPQ